MAGCKNCSCCKNSLEAKCVLYTGANMEGFSFTSPVDLETLLITIGDTINNGDDCDFCIPGGNSEGDTVTWNNTTDSWVSTTPCLSKTLFVSTCGNDATAVIGNPLRPYQTIKGAVTAATNNTGQLIYVFPGTYTESAINKDNSATEKIGLSYYFSDGVTVNGTTSKVFDSSVTTGTTIIRGSGVLTTSGTDVIASSVNVTYDIQCRTIANTGTSGSGISFNAGTLYLKCTSITATGGSCIDVRTGATIGYVTCDLIDNSTSSLQASAVHFKNITATGSKWVFDVKYTKSNANGSGLFQAICLDTGNTGVPVIYYRGNVENITTVAAGGYTGGIGTNTGTLIFEGGDIVMSGGIGGYAAVNAAGTLVIKNAKLRSTSTSSSCALLLTNPPGGGICILENCILSNNSSVYGTITSSGNSGAVKLYMSGCKIINEESTTTSSCILLTNASNLLVFDNCIIYSASATGVSLNTTVNINTKFINCWTNVATGGAGIITDLLQSLNVDADVLAATY